MALFDAKMQSCEVLNWKAHTKK